MTARWAALAALASTLGLDSLRAGVALGVLRRAGRWRTPLAFGVADAVAALAGSVAGEHVATASSRLAAWVAAAVLAGYGVAALVDRDGARHRAEGADETARQGVARSARGLGVALPVALSMDNLVAGLGLGVLGVPVPVSVLALGAASGAMAAVGVAVGRRLGARRVPSDRVAGVTMLAVAVLLAAGVG